QLGTGCDCSSANRNWDYCVAAWIATVESSLLALSELAVSTPSYLVTTPRIMREPFAAHSRTGRDNATQCGTTKVERWADASGVGEPHPDPWHQSQIHQSQCRWRQIARHGWVQKSDESLSRKALGLAERTPLCRSDA